MARKPAPRAPRTPRRSSEEGALALDRAIHEPLRLGIVTALAARSPVSFTDLKELLGTTDGNLSVHARKLEDAGYVAVEKSFAGRIPRTVFRLTPAGRRAFERYVARLEAVLAVARGASG